MRTYLTTECAIKSLDEEGRFAGYASVFGVVDHQRDMVMPGAFTETAAQALSEIKLLWQHQWAEPIGKITRLFEDARGLYIEGQLLLEVARAREAYALMKEGVLRGLSIGYRPEKTRIDPDTGVRQLQRVSLFEISIVTMPANPDAQVSVVKHVSHPPAEQNDLAFLLTALERAAMTLRSY